MGKPVKSRPYNNVRRQAQAQATRADVIAAGRQLFTDRGYAATTIDAVAQTADTAPATVYRLFGSKRGLLAAVLDVSFAGDDEPVAFGDRPQVRELLDEPDPRRMIDGFVRLRREMLDRSAPLEQVLRSAAAVDPEAAELLATTDGQRFTGQSRIAHTLAQRNALADGVGEKDAADIIFTLMSFDVHRTLTTDRRWSADRYQRWLTHALCDLLLGASGGLPPG